MKKSELILSIKKKKKKKKKKKIPSETDFLFFFANTNYRPFNMSSLNA